MTRRQRKPPRVRACVRPPRVRDIEKHWADPPPEVSARCLSWADRIQNEGWRPGRRLRTEGYYGTAEYLGIYIWELFNVIGPLLDRLTGGRAYT